MLQFFVKFSLSALMIVLISEAAKRSTWLGAILASLPITSILAFCWLYHDTGSVVQIAALARGIFWLVLPSLVLFITLPMLLDRGVTFVWALLVACGLTAVAYGAMMVVLPRLGVNPG